MKESGTKYWQSPNIGATNSSGFSGLPGGYRYYMGHFLDLRNNSMWWSSTVYDIRNVWFRYLGYSSTKIFNYNDNKYCGFSVRCIKDK
jgi:uncharacterized protein (TIGR02145 family)